MTIAPTFDPDAASTAGSGVYGLPFTPDESRVVIVPVPFEATTSYGGGTSRGPAAILRASRQVDLYDHETGRPYERGIAMLPISKKVGRWNARAKKLAAPIVEAGGETGSGRRQARARREVNAFGDRVNGWVYERSRELLESGKLVAVLGGDHSVPFGSIQAHAERHPGVGILHLDAHADLRHAYEGFTWSHASIFYNVISRVAGVAKLVQVGIRDLGLAEAEMIRESDGRIVTFFDAGLACRRDDGEPFARIADEIVDSLPHEVYLSWDIDGLDPTLCPSTGTPVPGGLDWHEAMALLRAVVRSGRRIIGLDLCEVVHGPTEWDANVGARLLYKMIGFALLSERAGE